MVTAQRVCQELVDDIIGYLHDDKATLCAYSLTSPATVVAAQRGLFSEIYVWARPRGPTSPPAFTVQRLVEMMKALPHIATYVRSLHITLDPTGLDIPLIDEFSDTLPEFRQLTRFSFSLYALASTSKLLLFLAFTIPCVLCCPTLRHVELLHMTNILPGNASLKHLVLCSYPFELRWSPILVRQRAALEFLALDAGMDSAGAFFDRILIHKGLDLSGVKKLYINTGFQATILDNAHVNRFLRVCGVTLRSLKLSLDTTPFENGATRKLY